MPRLSSVCIFYIPSCEPAPNAVVLLSSIKLAGVVSSGLLERVSALYVKVGSRSVVSLIALMSRPMLVSDASFMLFVKPARVVSTAVISALALKTVGLSRPVSYEFTLIFIASGFSIICDRPGINDYFRDFTPFFSGFTETD